MSTNIFQPYVFVWPMVFAAFIVVLFVVENEHLCSGTSLISRAVNFFEAKNRKIHGPPSATTMPNSRRFRGLNYTNTKEPNPSFNVKLKIVFFASVINFWRKKLEINQNCRWVSNANSVSTQISFILNCMLQKYKIVYISIIFMLFL